MRPFSKVLFGFALVILFLSYQSFITFAAETVLFSDDFNDNNSEGWNEQSPWGDWSVINQEYVGNATYQGSPAIPSYSLIENQLWQNYTLDLDIRSITGIDKQILFRVNTVLDKSYILNFRSEYFNGGNDLILAKRSPLGTENASLLYLTDFPNNPNQIYKVNIETLNLTNNTVQIKVKIDGSLVINYIDIDNPILNGGIGLEVVPGGYQPVPNGLVTSTAYDNLIVREKEYSDPTVPNLKQYDPLWKNNTYDHAAVWSPAKATIERWGCALTSAAMILNYYGHQITPSSLNSYLKENNGYTRNGSVVWGKIAKYAKDNETETLPALEYVRSAFSVNALDTELSESRPAILSLLNPQINGQHFVVATKKQENEYLMNDPASENTQLSFYPSNTYQTINSFIPSHTDLSAISLYIDKQVNLKVFAPNGEEITTGFQTEYPLEDDLLHKAAKTKPLMSFYLPKPQVGIYLVEVSGNGNYQLDSYLFDSEGNSTDTTLKGSVRKNQKEYFLLKKAADTSIQKISIENLSELIEKGYKEKKFKNKVFYNALKLLVKTANTQYERGNKHASYSLLLAAQKQVQAANAATLDPQFKTELLAQIDTLLEYLY